VEVTLLEDQALVTRRGKLSLAAGAHRLRVVGVAPVLQDVSLRAEVIGGNGRVSDVHVRRAIRVVSAHKSADVQALDEELRTLRSSLLDLEGTRASTEHRLRVVEEMLGHGAAELPQDVAWGHAWPEVWRQTFTGLFERARALHQTIWDQWFEQTELAQELSRAVARRRMMERPDQHLIAVVDIDLVAESDGEYAIEIGYTVPNALWRPIHAASLSGDHFLFECKAAVWQNTGEDWPEVRLTFSTARTSLGTDPPLLSDDLLATRRKSTEVRVEARQVEVEQAQLGGGPPSVPAAVDLPGVDDGGDVQSLVAPHPVTLQSDGRPSFVPLSSFEGSAATERIAVPELNPRLFLRAVLQNLGRTPLLAGPVELIRESEVVGWTQTNFVAPGERFELSFGPEVDVRISRHVRQVSEKVDEVDKWTRRLTEVRLTVSNLGDTPQVAQLRERIPVSEIEHVKVSLIDRHTRPAPELDEHGFCTWRCELAPWAQQVVQLRWELALAPGVKGL